jgi:hypothetical protein
LARRGEKKNVRINVEMKTTGLAEVGRVRELDADCEEVLVSTSSPLSSLPRQQANSPHTDGGVISSASSGFHVTEAASRRNLRKEESSRTRDGSGVVNSVRHEQQGSGAILQDVRCAGTLDNTAAAAVELCRGERYRRSSSGVDDGCDSGLPCESEHGPGRSDTTDSDSLDKRFEFIHLGEVKGSRVAEVKGSRVAEVKYYDAGGGGSKESSDGFTENLSAVHLVKTCESSDGFTELIEEVEQVTMPKPVPHQVSAIKPTEPQVLQVKGEATCDDRLLSMTTALKCGDDGLALSNTVGNNSLTSNKPATLPFTQLPGSNDGIALSSTVGNNGLTSSNKPVSLSLAQLPAGNRGSVSEDGMTDVKDEDNFSDAGHVSNSSNYNPSDSGSDAENNSDAAKTCLR